MNRDQGITLRTLRPPSFFSRYRRLLMAAMLFCFALLMLSLPRQTQAYPAANDIKPSLRAQPFYVNVAAGLNLVAGENLHVAWTSQLSPGWLLGSEVGYTLRYLPLRFSLESAIIHNNWRHDSANHLQQIAFLANTYYDLVLSPHIAAFLGGGAGFALNHAAANPVLGANLQSNHRASFVVQAVAGAYYHIGRHWQLTETYHFLANFGAYQGVHVPILFNNMITLALGYRW